VICEHQSGDPWVGRILHAIISETFVIIKKWSVGVRINNLQHGVGMSFKPGIMNRGRTGRTWQARSQMKDSGIELEKPTNYQQPAEAPMEVFILFGSDSNNANSRFLPL
jgi:hypothetical protein